MSEIDRVAPSNVGSLEVRIRSSKSAGWVVSFPCDADGNVDIDQLSDVQRHDYLFARAMLRSGCARASFEQSTQPVQPERSCK
jgi:hypothetical protein